MAAQIESTLVRKSVNQALGLEYLRNYTPVEIKTDPVVAARAALRSRKGLKGAIEAAERQLGGQAIN